MLTIQQIKADLNEIRYYYTHEQEFAGAIRTIGKSSIFDKLERYNEAIRKASAQQYNLYVALYVQGSTQLNVALDWERTPEHIKRLNRQLCQFFQKEFNKE